MNSYNQYIKLRQNTIRNTTNPKDNDWLDGITIIILLLIVAYFLGKNVLPIKIDK